MLARSFSGGDADLLYYSVAYKYRELDKRSRGGKRGYILSARIVPNIRARPSARALPAPEFKHLGLLVQEFGGTFFFASLRYTVREECALRLKYTTYFRLREGHSCALSQRAYERKQRLSLICSFTRNAITILTCLIDNCRLESCE
ncbi:hypothetical protein EVAR_11956_1 [Eumeta japonica]|uniref:Uncharacterized protein n=1 Tax=Eumeta variegata TaxID=151549 RepID=A0A4C1U5G5_EUMVA|nr:hypothetical protein EVAR_11956_1 [Eumeta japonica]